MDLISFQATKAPAWVFPWPKSEITLTEQPVTCGCIELTPETSTTTGRFKSFPMECKNFHRGIQSQCRYRHIQQSFTTPLLQNENFKIKSTVWSWNLMWGDKQWGLEYWTNDDLFFHKLNLSVPGYCGYRSLFQTQVEVFLVFWKNWFLSIQISNPNCKMIF